MDENQSLNNKYQKIDEAISDKQSNVVSEKPKKKDKKIKEPKQKKEKVKKEKVPKEKKIKEPKEKKSKAEKPKKEKKSRLKKTTEETYLEISTEKLDIEFSEAESEPMEIAESVETDSNEAETQSAENTADEKERDEFVNVEQLGYSFHDDVDIDYRSYIDNDTYNGGTDDTVEKNNETVEETVISLKKEKPKKKDKKVKEPKQKKEKIKKEKSPKVKKEKIPKVKKVKELDTPKEKKAREPFTFKDGLTLGVLLVAIAVVVGVVAYQRYEPDSPDTPAKTTETESSVIQIRQAEGSVPVSLIQSDIPNVFYGFTTTDYTLKYYQYYDGEMHPVSNTGVLYTEIDMGNESLPVEIKYVELGGKIFGMGLFRADQHQDKYFYSVMVFKLTNLPEAFAKNGKALLLASNETSEDGGIAALQTGDITWHESFTVDLETQENSRFLQIVNRGMTTDGSGKKDHCRIFKEGYTSTGAVPFISSRRTSSEQDIFIKTPSGETSFAENVYYGNLLLTDGDGIIFMRKTVTGFDVVRKSGDEEEIRAQFYGNKLEYFFSDGYILDGDSGKLYNMRTNEYKTLVGYRMSDMKMMKVSSDGKYVVMLGTVKNEFDYQVHIFNLETGEYAKYVDKNFSQHSNLAFIDDTTVVYSAIDPNSDYGYTYTIIDLTKAKY